VEKRSDHYEIKPSICSFIHPSLTQLLALKHKHKSINCLTAGTHTHTHTFTLTLSFDQCIVYSVNTKII